MVLLTASMSSNMIPRAAIPDRWSAAAKSWSSDDDVHQTAMPLLGLEAAILKEGWKVHFAGKQVQSLMNAFLLICTREFCTSQEAISKKASTRLVICCACTGQLTCSPASHLLRYPMRDATWPSPVA